MQLATETLTVTNAALASTTETISPREIREALRTTVKASDDSPKLHTVLCMLISHWRGKLHCHTYNLYSGGWHVGRASREPTPKMRRMYGAEASVWLGRAEIKNLDDQAEFIRLYLDSLDAWDRRDESARQRTGRVWDYQPPLDDRMRHIARLVLAAPRRQVV